ncbi:hypothetical protein CEXT_332331 [Caerostris extrusa]|uniref:Ycf15 n=1 Tax=Caerostris extrusa TaxID=172846 RepID=A0AAV4RGT3_CAEEX|nr:hypothetical protein CEXT_332331 [Caerostris extrusa]
MFQKAPVLHEIQCSLIPNPNLIWKEKKSFCKSISVFYSSRSKQKDPWKLFDVELDVMQRSPKDSPNFYKDSTSIFPHRH